ncbi:MAG: endo-1,4-beta-xylanase, partial [Candidatus Limnocylindrales bacterium]
MPRRICVWRSLLAIGATIGLIAPLALSSAPVALGAGPVVVSSVDFNDSTTGTWSQSGSPTLGYVADGAGGQALSILRAHDYEGVQSPTGLLAHGIQYTFSMRAKLPDGTAGTTDVRFVVKPNYTWVANTTIDASGWKTVTGTYTLPDDVDPTAASVYIGSTDASDASAYTILIDDILITAPPAQPPTTTIDSVNFDNSTTGDWIQSGGPTLSYVDDGSGGKALSILRTNSWDGIQSPTGLLAADTQYTLSMRARLPDGASGSTGVRFVVNHDSSQYDWAANGTINATGWTALTGTYTLPSGSDPSTAKIYIGSDDASDSSAYAILIDDILITGPAPSGGGTGVLNSDCSGGYVGLTYDDGPYAGQTDKLVGALDKAHLRATFFDWGQHIAGNNSLVAAQAANGWVGNHTWDHTDLTTLTQDQITAELTQTQDAIKSAIGTTPVLMRPPYGATNATVKAVEASLGLTEVLWDVDSQDWNGATTAQIVAKVHAATAGQVVLMHDGLATTRDAIPLIADALSARKMCPGMINPATGQAVAPPAQMIINTDFENGGMDGWVARNAQGNPTVELTTDEAHSPTHAARVSNRSGQGDGIGHDVTGIMKNGTKYVITAWVKFAAGSPTDSLWLSMRRTVSGADTYDTVAQFTNVPGDSWKQVTATYSMAAADSAFLYFETKYPDGTTASFLVDDISVQTQSGPTIQKDLPNLKDSVSFPVGVAIDSRETTGAYSELTLKHFNQITPENHMKPEAWYDASKNFRIHPEAKALMDYASANGIRVWGHTLVWHQQTPDWFFQHDDGTPLTSSDADKAILRTRLHDHIFNIAKTLSDMYGPFGSATNPLVGFDAVNEVVSDSSSDADGLRHSAWYNTLGEEYIEDAFNYAEQAFNVQYAASGVTRPIKLAINEYNTDQGAKRQRLHDLVALLLSHNVPVDIVGHQFHVNLSTNVQTLGDALTAFEDLPVKQDVSELDVMTGTPVDDAKLIDQGYFYRDVFRIFRAHSSSLFSVTVWGLYDGRSWRSDNYPLLFTDSLQAKPAFYGAIDGKLDPRIRTANVFQADVPLDSSATTTLEWKKLPLLTFGDKVGFQLRWESDHLSVYVAVKDATSDATDAITFKVGDTTYSFNRSGTGDVPGVVSEVTGGWVAVVHIPLSGAKLNDQLKFDVSVTDGSNTVGWNDPGAVGTLTLIEPLSFVDIAPANVAPTIDGVEDPVWALANTVTTDKQVSGTNTATAAVKTLWKGNTLYVLAHVTDPNLDATASDPWQQDSV